MEYSCVIFFFKQKTAYEMRISDWSSDVCSSDLGRQLDDRRQLAREAGRRLPGPAVAKIKIHRAVMQRMGGFDHPADARRTAEIFDRAAVVRTQIGHRDAELVEAKLVQRANQRPVDMSQLDFSEKADRKSVV